ncbi:unnamed protein product [Timema podura]|uniref:Uncharacterized protein n=1 Tax=Timema podura TaxID=61482 RepID=A0ABN7NUS0_TIMPD|nr:unnamed protein product [Timema podura]
MFIKHACNSGLNHQTYAVVNFANINLSCIASSNHLVSGKSWRCLIWSVES